MSRDPLVELVEAERACAEPPEGAGDRNWQALEARMAASAVAPIAWKPPAAALAGPAAVAKVGLVTKIVLVGAMLGAGAAGVVAYTSERPARVSAPALAPAAPTELPSSVDEALEEAPAVAAPPASPHAAPAPARSSSASPSPSASAGFAEELRVLKQAQRELKNGNPGKALELLEQHDKRFPRGLLDEERAAARVLALCNAGREAEGRAAAAEFVRRFPGSPHTDRVTGACASRKEK